MGRRRDGRCRCDGTSAGVTWHTEERRHVVTHDLGVGRRDATVTFRFPVATCVRCGRLRALVDQDFVDCWASITTP